MYKLYFSIEIIKMHYINSYIKNYIISFKKINKCREYNKLNH